LIPLRAPAPQPGEPAPAERFARLSRAFMVADLFHRFARNGLAGRASLTRIEVKDFA